MYCPKCGSSVEDGIQICPNCNFNFTSIVQQNGVDKENVNEVQQSGFTAQQSVGFEKAEGQQLPIKMIAYFILAAVVLVMFFMAASNISKGGLNITEIKSVGGKTLEEAYYCELGNIYDGYAMIARACGIFFASVLVWLGWKK